MHVHVVVAACTCYNNVIHVLGGQGCLGNVVSIKGWENITGVSLLVSRRQALSRISCTPLPHEFRGVWLMWSGEGAL